MEALNAIMEYGKNELGLDKVYCRIREDNEVSIKIAKRLGFENDTVIYENKHNMIRMVQFF